MLEAGGFQDSAGLALRIPLLQWITISASGSSSLETLADFAERNQLRRGDIADLVLVRLAHVDQDEVIAAIELRL